MHHKKSRHPSNKASDDGLLPEKPICDFGFTTSCPLGIYDWANKLGFVRKS
jgi:hypothetical protein